MDFDHKTATVDREHQYHTQLAREVPWCGKTSRHPDWDPYLCTWCQENPRIVVDPDVIDWCQRCYTLHYKRDDGTFIKPDKSVSLAKDLRDIATGKLKPKYISIEKPDFKVYKEE